MKTESISNPWLNRFAWLTAAATLLLVIAGALVTSHRAGLSVPDWPTTYGKFMYAYPLSKMVGGIRYEHTHRLIASTVGIFTMILALWLVKSEARASIRRLGIIGLAAVIAQGLLGGLTVLHYLPPAVSSAHAALAQAFFCVTIAIALFTSTNWQTSTPTVSVHAGKIRLCSIILTIAAYVQLLLGAAVRHSEHGLHAHIGGAVVVLLAAIAVAAIMLLGVAQRSFFMHAWGLAIMVVCQIGLGIASYVVHVPKTADEPLSTLQIVLPTLHVTVGALILAGSFVLALKSFYFLQPAPDDGALPLGSEVAS